MERKRLRRVITLLPLAGVAIAMALAVGGERLGQANQPTAEHGSRDGGTGVELETESLYGLELAAYATVRRDDGSYRRMLVSREILKQLTQQDALPNGTRILMETYYRPDQVSTVFHKQKVEAAWHYGSFPASRPDLSVRPQASCLSCHARAAETDFTFTLPSLSAAAEGRGPSDFVCERGGRSPCSSGTYLKGASP